MSALATAGVAAAIGFACGKAITPERPALPAAGTDRDDGTGVLARASSDDALPSLLASATAVETSEKKRESEGGAPFGGTRYGGYHFDRLEQPAAHASRFPDGYMTTNAGRRGSLHGRVLWPRPPRASATLPGPPGCPARVENQTLTIDQTSGGVARAVVYLADVLVGRPGVIGHGDADSTFQVGGVLRTRACQFVPRVQLISPPGSLLQFISESQTPGRITLTADGEERFSLPATRGAPQRIRLSQAGFFEVRDARASGSAWVVIPSQPYYAITADDGSFRLDGIAPGAYTLVAWHPPVATAGADGSVHWSAAAETRTRVRVVGDRDKRMTIELPRADEEKP